MGDSVCRPAGRGHRSAPPADGTGGDLHPGHLGHQLRGPLHRNVMAAGQVRGRADASGPKLARARTNAGSPPSLTASHQGHCFACATCPVTSGGGAGRISRT